MREHRVENDPEVMDKLRRAFGFPPAAPAPTSAEKPTAEQIVAALLCRGCSECPNCDYFVNDTGSCDGGRIAKEAAELIERQAARIRELEAKVDAVRWRDAVHEPPQKPGSVIALCYGLPQQMYVLPTGQYESPSGVKFSAEDGVVTHWKPI